MADFMKKNGGAMDKFLSTAATQVKVLAASSREREEVKEMLRQMGRYDAETAEYLTSQMPADGSMPKPPTPAAASGEA